MPWKEVTQMSSKLEFVRFALSQKHTMKALCERYGISRKTGYALLKRYQAEGEAGLQARSRKPLHSPRKTKKTVEKKITTLRKKHPGWGAKKIHAYLAARQDAKLPAVSTMNKILHRHGCIEETASPSHQAFKRFEREVANDLWQVDFKGHFELHQGRCHPLTMLDDFSRFSVGLYSCSNERADTAKAGFTKSFETYGLPYQINFDNGPPWATMQRHDRYTALTLWLIRLNIRISFSRPRHPQTNGKIERFHRTLKDELLRFHAFRDLKQAQRRFEQWRHLYNFERPHEALQMQPPATRYQPSRIVYPRKLPDIIYLPEDIVRHVDKAGNIYYQKRKIFVGECFYKQPVALRFKEKDTYDIYFCRQKILSFDF